MRLRASERASANAFNYSLRCGGTSCRKTSVFFVPFLRCRPSCKVCARSDSLLIWKGGEKKGKLVPLRFEFLSSKPAKVSFSESLFQYWLVLTTQPSSLLDLKTQTEVLRSLLDWNCLKHFIQRLSLYLHLFSSDPLSLKDTVKWKMHFSSSNHVLILLK